MARTINGNLTGKAARLEREDMASAALERSPFTKKFEAAYTSLIDVMGDEFFTWYDSPEFNGLTNGQMLIVMQGKLASFTTEENADLLHALVSPLVVEVQPAADKASEAEVPFNDPRTPAEIAADEDWQDEQVTRADLLAGLHW